MEEGDKRFLVFGHDSYYPAGGLADKRGSFDTVEEANTFIKKGDRDFYDIYDRIKGVKVS